jgi:hypothetical protein
MILGIYKRSPVQMPRLQETKNICWSFVRWLKMEWINSEGTVQIPRNFLKVPSFREFFDEYFPNKFPSVFHTRHFNYTSVWKHLYLWTTYSFLSPLTLYIRSADRFISRPSPYRAVNTFNFGCKNQSVYAVSGTSRCLFSDKYKTHKYSVGRAYSCWIFNLLVHDVTNRI